MSAPSPRARFLALCALAVGCSTDAAATRDEVDADRPDAARADAGLAADANLAADTSLPPPPESPRNRDGMRLRAVYQTSAEDGGADDERGFRAAWHDTLLDVDCRFVQTGADEFRCFPVESGGLQVYSTPTCEPGTDLMALLVPEGAGMRPTCEPGYIWHGYEDTQCAANTRGRALKVLGPAMASLETHPYVGTFFGDCHARPAPPPPPDPGPRWVYCEIEDTADAAFVSATAEIRSVEGVRQQLLIADDGAREVHALLHADADIRLYRDWFSGNTLLAEGVNFSVEGAVGAPQCVVPGTCDAAGTSACAGAVVVASGCRGAAFLLEPAEAGGAACADGMPANGPCLMRPGAELASLPYEEVRLGSGRLRPLWVGHDAEPLLPTGRFWDEAKQLVCSPQDTVDGLTRCLPDTTGPASNGETGWRKVFAVLAPGGQCDEPLGYVYLPRCDEAAPSVARVASKFLAMTRADRPAPGVVYVGIGPPGDEKYQCRPLDAAPEALYDATELMADDFAPIVRATAP